jgi:HEAT repeats
MAHKVPKCRLSTRMMIGLIVVSGLLLGLFELSWRNVWGPWPRWVRAIHSNEDYYNITLSAAMRAVEGKDPDVSAQMAIPELISALDDPKDLPRIAAITSLGRAGPRASKAVPKLIVLLKTPPPWIQGHVAHALGEIVTQD